MKLQHQIDRLLALRASEWHQILESADSSQRAEFVAWLKQSPRHVAEYLEIVYAERALQCIDPERVEDVEALLAQIAPNVLPLNAAAQERQSPGRPFAGKRWVALAAAVALCAFLLPLAFRYLADTSQYATSIGEQRTIQLTDASIVTLNADSRLEVRLDESRRDIQLLRGEALFDVTHDAARPFRVRTSTAIIQAVGTQFNVHARPSGTQVSVLEGRVKVTPQVRNDSAAVMAAPAVESLDAGQEMHVRPDGSAERKTSANVMRTVAWRERRLIFENASLEDMVYEFNRYNRAVRLTLDGVIPGSHHYNGIFDAADPDSLAELLSKEPDLSVERRQGEIVIRPRWESAP